MRPGRSTAMGLICRKRHPAVQGSGKAAGVRSPGVSRRHAATRSTARGRMARRREACPVRPDPRRLNAIEVGPTKTRTTTKQATRAIASTATAIPPPPKRLRIRRLSAIEVCSTRDAICLVTFVARQPPPATSRSTASGRRHIAGRDSAKPSSSVVSPQRASTSVAACCTSCCASLVHKVPWAVAVQTLPLGIPMLGEEGLTWDFPVGLVRRAVRGETCRLRRSGGGWSGYCLARPVRS